MRNKRLLGSVVSTALLLSVVGCGQAANTTNQTPTTNQTTTFHMPAAPQYSGPVVATYQGGNVTKGELDKQYNLMISLFATQQPPTKKDFLTNYVVAYRYLYDQAVKQNKTPVTDAQIKQVMDQVNSQLVTQYKTQQALDKKMTSLGLTQSDLAWYVKKYEYLSQYVQTQIKGLQVSDSATKIYYDQHKADYTQVSVHHILVKTQKLAQLISKQLKAGANFEKLADKYSTDPSAKQNHGNLGKAAASTYVSQFANACLTLKIGEISDPVHTQFGYHVIRVDSRTVQPYTEVKNDIKQTLLPQIQNQKENTIFQNAVKAAKVKIVAKDTAL